LSVTDQTKFVVVWIKKINQMPVFAEKYGKYFEKVSELFLGMGTSIMK